jgi:hypothetical protein
MNITAFSFTISAVLAGAISLKSYWTFKKQSWNKATQAFYQALLCFTFYVFSRAIVSIFFVDNDIVLTSAYILSHVFLGLASAFLAKFALLSVADSEKANKVFSATIFLFFTDILLNIFFPNKPEFDAALNIIKWGTQKYVGIYHTVLLLLVFLSVAVLFISKALSKNCHREVKIRSWIISAGLIFSILFVIPRNIFSSPILTMISDLGYTLTFFLIFWALTTKIN